MAQSEFVGVDWCSAGWLSVGLSASSEYELKGFFAFEDLLDYYATANLILVDIPIGLPNFRERRCCDREARDLLPAGWGKSSVYSTPTRHTVNIVRQSSGTYQQIYSVANRTERRFSGKGLPRQTFGITSQIGEVNACLPVRTPIVREVHPEICFWALNRQRNLGSSKRCKAGEKERVQILKCVESRTEVLIKDARRKFSNKYVALHDILDALAAAVTAYGSNGGYGSHQQLMTLPTSPPRDLKNLSIEMVYWVPPNA